MRVTVIGTGYVGLVSGVCFAEIGHDVTCVDINPQIIEMLNRGESPIYEPGLSDLITSNIKRGRINFSTDYKAVSDSKVIFLAVGTPSTDEGSANLEYLNDATVSVAKYLSDNSIVVIKSTVPIGTNSSIKKLISENTDKKFHLVNNPEFLKEGAAIDDFMKPDRVVIGTNSKEASSVMNDLYAPLMIQGNPIYHMSNLSAEMTKYTSNCMLATKISFINEIARLCDLTGADINEVRQGITSDKRIGNQFLYPGPGYGGSCFPKDVKALIYTSNELGYDLRIMKAVEEINREQKVFMFEKIMNHFDGDLEKRVFSFWGVSFKPKTDDIREAPSIIMARALIEQGATVNFYDPEGADNFYNLMESSDSTRYKVKKYDNKYDCLNGSDGLIIMTEWVEFRAPDYLEIKSRLKTSNLFDARNICTTEKVLEAGLNYFAIGKFIANS